MTGNGSGETGERGKAPPHLRLVSGGEAATKSSPGAAGGAKAAETDVADVADAGPAVEPAAAKPSPERDGKLRVLEAVLFASPVSLTAARLGESLGLAEDPTPLLFELQRRYEGRGVNLVRVAGRWAFRTAPDLGYLLKRETVEERRLSKAALETLAIIAYHQPVTRAEIEAIRGVSTSAGTLDILLETQWIRPRGRRRAPGRPVTYGTTDAFLEHFGLEGVRDLPGLGELQGAGLLSAQLPPGFTVPAPSDVAALMPDELPLEDDEEVQQEELDLDEEAEPSADTGDAAAAEGLHRARRTDKSDAPSD